MSRSFQIPPVHVVAAVAGWLVIAILVAVLLTFEQLLANAGRSDLTVSASEAVLFLLPIASAATVGSALAARRPRHPIGWLFLGLAFAVTSSGLFDSYAIYGSLARPGSLPGAEFVAVLADVAFVPWIWLLCLILVVTPDGTLRSRTAGTTAIVATASAALAIGLAILEPYRGEYAHFETIQNPLAVESIADELRIAALTCVVVLHLAVVVAIASVFQRFRRASAEQRRQLRWFAVALVPFPVLVAGAFVAATVDNQLLLTISASGFVAVLPIAAGLAIEQDHLYDVDRLLSRGLTYVLLSSALIACYAVAVIFVGESLGDFRGDSQVAAVIATLAAVSIALPLRRWLQDGLDRRFNRRQFEAAALVREYVRAPDPERSLEQVLRAASGDDRLQISYWIDDRAKWVREDGSPAVATAQGVRVERRGQLVANVTWDSGRVDESTVKAITAAAATEIENARLRAAIALQLVEVRESRARIVEAQQAERRKLERNLHDGAQQRLLSTAMNLRVASAGSNDERLRSAIDSAVDQLQVEVRELRDIANGLHPAILHEGGLSAALDDLAGRSGSLVQIDTCSGRFPPKVEEAAWFIACEALSNAVKHAASSRITISSRHQQGQLVLEVEDDGIGGANPTGPGLRGIADRAEALGGILVVGSGPEGGTLVRAVIPCDV